MNHQISILDNGLRIVTAEMIESQSVTASVVVGIGSRFEEFEVNGGVSHFLEHLLFRGTKQRPSAKQISEEIDAVGGWNNAYTSNDLTNYYVKVPKQHSALALDILSDMIQNSLFDSADIDRERSVIVEEMNVWRDDPSRYVGNLLPPLLWPGDPLSQEVIGSEEVITTISRQAIINYQQQHYGASNMVVAVAGNLTHEAVVEQVARQMGGIKPGRRPALPQLQSDLSQQLVNELAKDTNQAHFLIGCQAYGFDHPSTVPARVVAAILGRGMSSRLFSNVREKLGLAYAVNTDYQSYVDTGYFETYAGVNLDKIPQAIEAVMAELSQITHEPVAKNELLKAKNQLRSGLQMSIENNVNVADRLGSQLVLRGQIKTIDESLAEVDAVTIEEVEQVARELLQPERLRMAIITPDTDSAKQKFEELVGEPAWSKL